MKWKYLLSGIAFGMIITLTVGFVENRFVIGIPENRFYGYPFVWRIEYFMESNFFSSTFILNNLIIDNAIWTTISLVVAYLMKTAFHR